MSTSLEVFLSSSVLEIERKSKLVSDRGGAASQPGEKIVF